MELKLEQPVNKVRLRFGNHRQSPSENGQSMAMASDRFQKCIETNTCEINKDPLNLTGPKPGEKEAEGFLSRFQARQSTEEFGSRNVAFEVGVQSEGPPILTSSRDSSIWDRATQPRDMFSPVPVDTANGGSIADNKLMTGTAIHPIKNLTLRAGMATSLDPTKVENSQNLMADIPNATQTDLYFDARYRKNFISANVQADTVIHGSEGFRVGTGIAIMPTEEVRVAFSYLHQQQQKIGTDTIKLGLETRPQKDLVTGLNLSTPVENIQTPDTQGLSAGAYISFKFR